MAIEMGWRASWASNSGGEEAPRRSFMPGKLSDREPSLKLEQADACPAFNSLSTGRHQARIRAATGLHCSAECTDRLLSLPIDRNRLVPPSNNSAKLL